MKKVIFILFMMLMATVSASALSPQSLEGTTWQTDDDGPMQIRLTFSGYDNGSIAVRGTMSGSMDERLTGEVWVRNGTCYMKLRNDPDASSVGMDMKFYGPLEDIASRKFNYDFELGISFLGRGQEKRGKRMFRRVD